MEIVKTILKAVIGIVFLFFYSISYGGFPESCKGSAKTIAETISEVSGARTVCSKCSLGKGKDGSEKWWGKCEWDKGSRIELNFFSSDADPFDKKQPASRDKKEIKNGALFDFEEKKSTFPEGLILRSGGLKCKLNDAHKPKYLGLHAYDAWNSGKIPKGYFEKFFSKLFIELYDRGICTSFSDGDIDRYYKFDVSNDTSKKSSGTKEDKQRVILDKSYANIKDTKIYTDNENKINFKYSSDFNYIKRTDGNIEFKHNSIQDENNYIIWEVKSRSFATSGNDDLQTSDLIKVFKMRGFGLPKIEVISEEEVEFSGLKGTQLTYTIPENNRYVVRTILDAGEFLYYIHLMSFSDQVNKLSPNYFLLLNTINNGAANSASGASSNVVETTFKHPYTDISFKHSDNYKIEFEGNEQYKFIPKDNDDTWIHWQIKERSLAANGNTKVTTSDLMSVYTSSPYSKREVIYKREVNYSGFPGTEYVYLVPKNNRYIRRTILDAGNYFYYSFLTTREPQYSTYKGDYELMLNSLMPRGKGGEVQQLPDEKSKSINKDKDKAKAKTKAVQKKIENLDNVTQFVDKNEKVSFFYPKEMQKVIKENKTRFKNKQGTVFFTYETLKYERDGGNYTDSKTMCEYLIAQMKKHYNAKQLGKIERINIDGVSGYKLRFKWKMETQDLEQVEIGLDGQDRLYTFGFLGTPQTFKLYGKKFNSLLNTIALGKESKTKTKTLSTSKITNKQKDREVSKPKTKTKDKTTTISAFVDGGSIEGKLQKDPVAVIFTAEKTGKHTIKCNSMNKAPIMMILYDEAGKNIDSNFENKQLYKGISHNLEKGKSYFFFVAPLNDEDTGKIFDVEVISN